MKYKLLIYPAISSLLLFAASPAFAQVYKCTGADNKVIYSDKTCASGTSQIVTGIQGNIKPADSNAQSTGETSHTTQTINRQLDEAVKLAISNDDLIRAQALATTKEQKQWVATAKKEAATKLASADSSTDKANSYACQQAQRNLQKETDSSFQDQTLILAKTRLMYSKCGISVAGGSYANQTPSSLYNPGFFNRGFFNPGVHHHQPWPGNTQPGYTSEPYDRTRASPFGSRWIRPEN